MTQAWRWDQQLAITAGAYAEYDDGSGGRSLQEDEEDLSLIICEIPTEGCKNGMYNVKKCACECIPPYCPYVLGGGDCTLPSADCGGNPWGDCKRGLDCPWWINPLKAESCTTGPQVPPDTWQIYNHEKACCNINFPFSKVCGRSTIPTTDPPTKYPTVQAPEEDNFEIVPLKFDLGNLPQDISIRGLRDEMKTVLQRILVRLAGDVPELKISSIEEKILPQQRRGRILRGRKISIFYNVYVVRQDGVKFGPLIISEIRSRYDEVKDQLRQFSDVNFLAGGIDFNLCTSQSGDFTVCARDLTASPTPPKPTPRPRPKPGASLPVGEVGISGINGRDGLAAWAIALIALVSATALLCFVYLAYLGLKAVLIDEDKDTKVFVSDKSLAGRSVRTRSSRRSKKSRDGSSRPLAITAHGEEDDQLVMYDNRSEGLTLPTMFNQDRFTVNSEASTQDFTINTRTTRDQTLYLTGPSVGGRSTRVGRDPTMYVPGGSRRPDPSVSGTILMIDDGGHYSSYSRRYGEDYEDSKSRQSTRPKRDPTMYVDGATLGTRYKEGGQGRDPTMYDDDDQSPLYLDAPRHDEPSYATEEPGQRSGPAIYCYGDEADEKSGITMPTALNDGVAYYNSPSIDGVSFKTQEPGVQGGSLVTIHTTSDFGSKLSRKSGKKSRKRGERRYA